MATDRSKFDLDHSCEALARIVSMPERTQARTPETAIQENPMQTEILKVKGMNSAQCADTVTRTLTKVAGVSEVSVSLPLSQATVQFDETLAALPQFKSALADAGFDACATKVEKAAGSCCGGCCH
jgi:copper chaperone